MDRPKFIRLACLFYQRKRHFIIMSLKHRPFYDETMGRAMYTSTFLIQFHNHIGGLYKILSFYSLT